MADKKEKKEEEIEETEYIDEEGEVAEKFGKKLKKLKEKLNACQKEKEEYLTGWQKERADFVNYKKLEAEKLQTMGSHQKELLFSEILAVLDNIERAEMEMTNELKESQWGKGFLGISVQMKYFLNKEGVKEMDVGKDFNPEFHEAIEVIEGEEDDKIIEIVQKGYLIKDKVLRPAMVKVGKKFKI